MDVLDIANKQSQENPKHYHHLLIYFFLKKMNSKKGELKKPRKGQNQNNPIVINKNTQLKGSVTNGPLYLYNAWMNAMNSNKLQQQFAQFLKTLAQYLTIKGQSEWSKAVCSMTKTKEAPYAQPTFTFLDHGTYAEVLLKNNNGNNVVDVKGKKVTTFKKQYDSPQKSG